ncbi:MAG: CDP-diacylglycerol--glycerol-3-phosphate 3-phosphatidyltransferase [Alphaproteobacteria bacterium]|nr:MAG: CDP-diacylglycerol--glycerol-3-phosphate 3-phosphatidyltransferase [Alphaproteobacteria bacterium]
MPINLPNILSITRIAFGPLCIWLLTQEAWMAALAVMIIGEITDFLDGFIARRYKQVTAIGKIIDPMADSLYRQIVFIGFHAAGLLPTWMLVILFSRDIIVSYLRVVSEQHGITLSARQSGKIKALAQGFAQMGVVILFILQGWDVVSGVDQFAFWLFLVATVVTAWSLVDYASAVFQQRSAIQDKS